MAKAKTPPKKTSMPEKILNISEGIDSLLNLKQKRTLDSLRNQVSKCCLQACNCCLQVS
jgi:hypothetical protein